MAISRTLREKLFPILVSRTVIFFFVMSLLTFFLYAAGTVQGFIDTTQLALLRLYSVLGIFLVVSTICAIMINIERFIRLKKTRYFLRAGAYLLITIFSVVTVIAAMFIITLSMGNGV